MKIVNMIPSQQKKYRKIILEHNLPAVFCLIVLN